MEEIYTEEYNEQHEIVGKEESTFQIIGNGALISIYKIGETKRFLRTELDWYGKLKLSRGEEVKKVEPIEIISRYGSEYSFFELDGDGFQTVFFQICPEPFLLFRSLFLFYRLLG